MAHSLIQQGDGRNSRGQEGAGEDRYVLMAEAIRAYMR